ncbi:MAG: hypothetical protein R3D52_07875 [Xanthobacteraceae bacterium]
MAHPEREHTVAGATLHQTQLQPEPLPEAQTEPSSGLSRNAWLGIGGAGTLLAVALAAGVISFGSKQDTPAPSPTTAGKSSNGASDAAQMFQMVKPAEIDQAVAALVMSEPQKEQVRQALKRNDMRIAWVQLSDSFDEDGDWVKVTAGGFSQNLRLFKKPLRFAIPYVPGAPVAVTGLIDGEGGGITVAVHSGASTFGLKPLVKGETIMVPTP